MASAEVLGMGTEERVRDAVSIVIAQEAVLPEQGLVSAPPSRGQGQREGPFFCRVCFALRLP